MCWYQSLLVNIAITGWSVRSQFLPCQDDPFFEPEEGIMDELQFTWLGVLQYIHIKNGTPHYFRAPRVVLISRQFVLATAKDAAQVPEEYALGNVIFGEYERDEDECGISIEEASRGAQCEPAIMIIPLLDVLLHPEYKHFGAENSVAILKLIQPIKSVYMVPVCLPYKNYLSNKIDPAKFTLWHVDFATHVPRDFFDEKKEVSELTMLPRELCFLYDETENTTTREAKKRVMCTTDCDFHSGAPTVLHEQTGHWTVVSISEGSGPCPDPLRTVKPPAPPRHVMLYPYVSWITAAITGTVVNMNTINMNDPFGFTLPRQAAGLVEPRGWVGKVWLGGLRCYDRGATADDLYRFYHEIFTITPERETKLTYFLQIYAAEGTRIVCVKVRMPYKMINPKVWMINTPEIMLRIPIAKLKKKYSFEVEAWGCPDGPTASQEKEKDEDTFSASDDTP